MLNVSRIVAKYRKVNLCVVQRLCEKKIHFGNSAFYAHSSQLGAYRQCVRDWSGILLETEAEAKARKDIAESPTAEPERPRKKFRVRGNRGAEGLEEFFTSLHYSITSSLKKSSKALAQKPRSF